MTQNQPTLQQQQLAFLEHRRSLYRHVAGGWPPTLYDGLGVEEVREFIVKDISTAKSFVEENPDILEGREIYADLLRMAHNVDVPGAAENASIVLRDLLSENPRNYQALLCIASLYVTLHHDLAELAEHYFNRALELRSESPDPSIFQGLGFASLNLRKRAQAIAYFKKYLELVPEYKRIVEFLAKLSAGAKYQAVFIPIEPNSQEPSYLKHLKRWWKHWWA